MYLPHPLPGPREAAVVCVCVEEEVTPEILQHSQAFPWAEGVLFNLESCIFINQEYLWFPQPPTFTGSPPTPPPPPQIPLPLVSP